MSLRFPHSALSDIREELFRDVLEGEQRKINETAVNWTVSKALRRQIGMAKRKYMVDVINDYGVNDYGPGPSPDPDSTDVHLESDTGRAAGSPDIANLHTSQPLPSTETDTTASYIPIPMPNPIVNDPAATVSPGPSRVSRWRESTIQLTLNQLRLEAGLLRPRKKRKVAGEDQATSSQLSMPATDPATEVAWTAGLNVTEDLDLAENAYDDRLIDAPDTVGPSPFPAVRSSATSNTDHISFVTNPDISTNAGLHKPDFAIIARTTSDDHTGITPVTMSCVGERKDDSNHARQGFAESIGYALTANQVFGTNFGFYWFQTKYVRFLIPELDVIILESTSQVRANFVPVTTTMTAPQVVEMELGDLLKKMTNDSARSMCVNHIWSEEGVLDQEAAQGIWDLWMHCTTLVLQHSTSCPRFKTPTSWDCHLRIMKRTATAASTEDVMRIRGTGGENLKSLAYTAYPCLEHNLKKRDKIPGSDEGQGESSSGGASGDGARYHHSQSASRDISQRHCELGGDGGGGDGEWKDTGSDAQETESNGKAGGEDDDRGVSDPGSTCTNVNDLSHSLSLVDELFRRKVEESNEYLSSLSAPPSPAHRCLIDTILRIRPKVKVYMVDSNWIDTLVGLANREIGSASMANEAKGWALQDGDGDEERDGEVQQVCLGGREGALEGVKVLEPGMSKRK